MDNKKKFQFDDEHNIQEDSSQNIDTIEQEITNDEQSIDEISNEETIIDEIPNEEETNDAPPISEEVKMTKKKKKFKIKFWHIIFILIFLSGALFLGYIYSASSNDGPVTGERCASILAVEKEKLDGAITIIKENTAVASVEINVECNTMEINMNFVDNTTSGDATTIATAALLTIDDTIGRAKVEGSIYSDLFGNANGSAQFDVEFILTSNGDTDFPIFGQKHTGLDEISFTGSNPANQATTDALFAEEGEVTQ